MATAFRQRYQVAQSIIHQHAAEIVRLRARLSLAERSVQELKADRSEVIEECAQFVKEYAEWRPEGRIDDADNLIAAIRALKDKP